MVKFVELFGNRSLAKLLDFFLLNDKEYSQTQIIKKTNLSKATAIKWLSKLEKERLIKSTRIGTTKLLIINKSNVITKQLKILKTLSDITSLIIKDAKIYLYGSAARGENDPNSDIDLLIIGKIKQEDIIKDIIDLSNKIKKEIKFEIFSFQEWSQMARKDPAFYERVEKDKIEIL